MKIPIFPGKYYQNGGFFMGYVSFTGGVTLKGNTIPIPKQVKGRQVGRIAPNRCCDLGT